MFNLRLSQYRPLRCDIEKRNKQTIIENKKKANFEIEKTIKNLPEDLKPLILQCIHKKVNILRTNDLRFKNFSDILAKFNLRVEYDF
jgi:hypothetical protein